MNMENYILKGTIGIDQSGINWCNSCKLRM